MILAESKDEFLSSFPEGIAKWTFVSGQSQSENEVSVYSVEEYKGLEANLVIYVHDQNTSENINYIAYTRAKYYLIELVRKI